MPLETTLGQIFASEFMGTAMLLLLGAGVCCAVSFNGSKAKDSGWLVIAFGWGFAVFAGVLVAFQSGGHLNPAVTIGLICAGKTLLAGTSNALAALVYIVAQFLGAFVGAALAWLAYKKQFDADQPEGSKLGVFSTGPALKSTAWNLVTELIATFVLVFVVLISGYQGNSGDLGWLNALGVAFLIVAIGVSLGGPTGYAINPARDLGPRLWHAVMPAPNKGSSDWGYSWIPVVGPLLGGIIAGLLYHVVKGIFPV
ncbi:MAG: aquaporin family protein [Propionibacteriaceae bacterium]|jgi:glycerol uptake facilitator protein|nr:aquaporin family protein [Propionibacteriaceae bacterium]